MRQVLPWILIPLILVGLMCGLSWTLRRSREMLDEWLSTSNLELVSAEFCWFWRGPFFWSSSNGQVVYRITAVDQRGEMFTGWARCGGYWRGLLVSKVEVRWDDNQL